ncbi:hypothetical protein CYG49_01670 [Candidatus Saccharibacteria bacterium]|nr:MAG: hypothetical protein CYG49_01670 [Candidatus Saccharibacteria bacterium]
MDGHSTDTYSYNFSFSSSDMGAVWILLLVFSAVLAIRYGLRYFWFRKRIRDIKGRNIVVAQYEAPPDIPPAFFGTIVDNRTSVQDFVATILSLQQQGFLLLQFDESKNDFFIQQSTQNGTLPAFEHEQFVLRQFQGQGGFWASVIRQRTVNTINEFNFLVQKDLQRAGYYKFHPKMDDLTPALFYGYITFRAIVKGVLKPWNWPGLLLSLFFPLFGVAWMIISLIFYSRLGLYNYRSKEWEKIWPIVAGYYNYLRVVEAEKRAFELQDMAHFTISKHDPYLVAALLQGQWSKVFTESIEIGADGKEYRTM